MIKAKAEINRSNQLSSTSNSTKSARLKAKQTVKKGELETIRDVTMVKEEVAIVRGLFESNHNAGDIESTNNATIITEGRNIVSE